MIKVKDRETYVGYHAHFGGGSIWGINQSVMVTYIYKLTGLHPATFFDYFSASSIGVQNVAALVTPDKNNPHVPGHDPDFLTKAFYACAMKLFSTNNFILARQALNAASRLVTNRNVTSGHYDQKVYERMIAPYFDGFTLSDTIRPVWWAAHNMSKKRLEWFGRHDKRLRSSELKSAPLNNGKTKILSAIMASTCLPAIFPMYHEAETGSYFNDLAPYVSPAMIHMDLMRMANGGMKDIQQRQQDKKRAHPLWWRTIDAALRNVKRGNTKRALSLLFNSQEKAKTLTNAKDVVIRTIVFNTGDISDLPFIPEKRINGELLDQFDLSQYGAYQASYMQTVDTEMNMLAAEHDAGTMKATGKPATTIFNARILAHQDDAAEVARFPSPNGTDASHGNLLKIYEFARDEYVIGNLDKILDVLKEITLEKYRRREFDKAEFDRLNAIYASETPDTAREILNKIIVTEENAAQVLEHFGLGRVGNKLIDLKQSRKLAVAS